MNDRRLTFIIVPHGDLETRRVDVSYRRLKWILRGAGALLVVFVVMAATWFYLATQVAQLPGLRNEVKRLEEEQQKLAELARTLSEVEAQYERVRQLLGADAAPGTVPYLPPLRQEGAADSTAGSTRPLGLRPARENGPATRLHFVGRGTPSAGKQP